MIEAIEPGALTSVQTAVGRPGWRHLGVPVGGAADAWSARLANGLVGNSDDAALLEITLAGPALRFYSPATVALAGARFEARIDGLELPTFTAYATRAGSTLRIGDGDGARAYLAVAGGIDVESMLGSAATDLRSGFGGHEGRALRGGDRLSVGSPMGPPRRWTGGLESGPIRIVPGPNVELRLMETLVDSDWKVGDAADRTGVRLEGPTLRATVSEVSSMGLPLGAVQVPPDGMAIVMLADRPVTGGYPVPACVIRADIGRVAQLRPGEGVRFASVSLEDARRAHRSMESQLEELEDLAEPSPAELGWSGALE